MADEIEILTINAAGNSWVDLIPAGIAEGYQAQNTNIEARYNGFDNTALSWNVGTSKLELAISGVVDVNGLPFVPKVLLELTFASAGIWYIKLIAGSDFEHMDGILVATPGTFDPSKMGFYQAGDRVLDWKIFYNGYAAPVIIKRNRFGFNPAVEAAAYPLAAIDTIVQDDAKGAIPLPAGLTYWPFSTPNIENSAGNAPTFRCGSIDWYNYSHASTKHTNRGIIYFNGGFLYYNYTLSNEMTIMLRIKPNFIYNVANDVTVLDSRNFSGSDDDNIVLRYDQATDKWNFRVKDDATHLIELWSNAYVANPALQIWTDIYIRFSKAGNDADMYINNNQCGVGGYGTKTVTGGAAAITGLNLLQTYFVMGAYAWYTYGPTGYPYSLFYVNDMAFANSSATTWLSNYNGGTVYPYYFDITKMLSGIGQNWQILQSGNAGFKQLSVESIDNGAGQWKMKIIPLGAWNMNVSAGGSAILSITHGINASKLIGIFCLIFDDSGHPFDLASFTDAGDPNLMQGGISHSGIGVGIQTTIPLRIRTGSMFDGVGTDNPTINRGYLCLMVRI
jgi:hypothetical protein